MNEDLKNTPNIDPSGLFDTYSANHDAHEIKEVATGNINPNFSKQNEQNTKNEPVLIKSIQIIADGFVRAMKVAAWMIAIFGGLFITALATNTINQAVEIINTNIGSQIVISGEEDVVLPTSEKTAGITSNEVISLPIETTIETIAVKRRAILEAKKASKMLEEKQETLENTLQ